MARKFDISRELDIDMTVPVNMSDYLKADNIQQAQETIAKAIESELNKQSDFEVTVEVKHDGFSDARGEAITEEDAKADLEEYFADITVTVSGTQNGTYEEGVPSYNYYEPDDPPELSTYDDADTITEISEKIEKVFKEFGFEIESSNIETKDNSRSWDSVIEDLYIEDLYEEPEPEYEPDYDYND